MLGFGAPSFTKIVEAPPAPTFSCPSLHKCCSKIAPGRSDLKLDEGDHVHPYDPDDCPSCYMAGHRIAIPMPASEEIS